MLHEKIRCWFLLGLSFFCMSFAPAGEKAFYAISSLCLHLHERVAGEEEIVFDAEDVERLWLAALDSPFYKEIQYAKECYYESGDLLIRSQQVLESVWENPYWEPELFTETSPLLVSHGSKYVLPDNHEIKSALDEIFYNPYVLDSAYTFQKAGFTVLHHQGTGMRVASHPLLPGYLIKTYLSSEERNDGIEWIFDRCKGANNIRKLIANEKLRYFNVPDKWIYPLRHIDKRGMYTQTAVLVVTHMRLVSDDDSRKAWKNASRKQIKELYSILSHGYASAYLPFNIPYTKEGKFTCIDTAYPKRLVTLKKARTYLSDEMKKYWDQLIKQGGQVP